MPTQCLYRSRRRPFFGQRHGNHASPATAGWTLSFLPVAARVAGWSKAKAQLDEASGVTNWRIHDLRRTFATGLQKLGVRLEVTEAVLNHVSGGSGPGS